MSNSSLSGTSLMGIVVVSRTKTVKNDASTMRTFQMTTALVYDRLVLGRRSSRKMGNR